MPRIEQELRELERKLDAAQTTYSLLLQRFQEAQVAENQNIGNAHVIQTAALLENPVAPNIPLNLAVGGLLGTLLAITTALLLEGQDKTIRSVREAKDLLGDVLLGIVPLHRHSRGALSFQNHADPIAPEIILHHAAGSPSSEAYRRLQSHLRSLCAEKELKTILVTSSIPREGKSTVSANLSLALAQTGRKVLLIDADLRCPKQHKLWHLPNVMGLNQILTEQCEMESAIQSVHPLDVLTAGATAGHPSTLLDSDRMTEFLQECSTRYDFVIVDTPAWNVAADVAILNQKADGMLFVVRPGVVDPASATFAKESLKQANQNILGLIINGITPAADSYYYDKKYSKQYYPSVSAPEQIPVVSKSNGSRASV
ncbi:polysaccharide biosynthesis tyrosine autokinase [Egbenema bharatensis]|uniref:polysaccharide biosynthesis tyrosine autokinase n=1 Tax=Egbenema bharatensis TaxID=3463334 RepID=UPI003A8763DD